MGRAVDAGVAVLAGDAATLGIVAPPLAVGQARLLVEPRSGRARGEERGRDEEQPRDPATDSQRRSDGLTSRAARRTRNRLSAAASIWRTRSRVTPMRRPMLSSVMGSSPPSPNRSVTTLRFGLGGEDPM